MPAAYYVRENKLTAPPSYSLQNLQQVVTEQVADGKFVRLETLGSSGMTILSVFPGNSQDGLSEQAGG
jgi:hypothetical protein